MNYIEFQDEELRQMFRKLSAEIPSVGFTTKVMARVAFEKRRNIYQKRIRLIAWVVSIPCVVSLLLIAVLFTHNWLEINLWKYFEPLFVSLKNTFASFTDILTVSGFRIVLLGLMFLALLLCDLFFRHYFERKELIQ